jgi:serine/threonine-protein kinase
MAPSRSPSPLARLALFGVDGGPSAAEALALFRALRTTPDEGRAIETLLTAATTRPLPEPLLLAVASALVDRGDPPLALRSLEGATGTSALLFRADLLAEGGDLAAALALCERVLLRDYDHPGARERHARWRHALGVSPTAPRNEAGDGATLVAGHVDTPFRLVREVARGGAGAVFEAEDQELGRRVAIKMVHHPATDRAQLTHETHVATALAGPGVVRVLDVDPNRGWLVLEWARAGALRDHVRAKDASVLLPIERWAGPLVAALARVHAAGWVHHDVKPANVLLASPEEPWLSDFGTARRVGEPSPPGSLGYVSPERLRGRASDPRDDVYGFGRVLEDVLNAVAGPREDALFRPLVNICTGPDARRPADARALVLPTSIA